MYQPSNCRHPLKQAVKSQSSEALDCLYAEPQENTERKPNDAITAGHARLYGCSMGSGPRRNHSILVQGLWHQEYAQWDGKLHYRLADIGAVVPKDRNELRNKCADLVFGSDLEEFFNGFDSERKISNEAVFRNQFC